MICVEWPWMSDAQLRLPLDTCMSCGAELYTEKEAKPDIYGHVYCPECRAELEDSMKQRYDQETVHAMMAEIETILKKYVSKAVSDEVWNELARKFTAA